MKETDPKPLSVREQRIAQGVALMHAGYTKRGAAELVGLPPTTLYAHYQRLLGPDAEHRDEERQRADERLLATAYCAADQLLERMATEVESADHRTVTAWTEASTRVIGRMRGWERGLQRSDTGEQIATVLERIADHGGAKLTLTVEPLDDDQ